MNHLSNEQRDEINKIIEKYIDRFYLKGERLQTTNLIKHEIPTITEVPIKIKQFRHPPVRKEEIHKQVKEVLDGGIIEPSMRSYAAPAFCIDKKPDPDGKKRYRVVIDFRKINEVIPDYNHPVPNITDILD